MIAGFGIVGQSSRASGTPSVSRSSLVVPQLPLLVTPILWQVSPPQMSLAPPAHAAPGVVHITPVRLQVKVQVHCCVLLWQRLLEFSAHVPVAGHWAFVVQIVSLVRLHEPVARRVATAPTQSPSQASPIPSGPSASCWLVFGVLTQLSFLSAIPSPSRSV